MDRQEHRVERRLAAIFAADVAAYSRLMSHDEVETLRTLTAHREVMDRLIAEHRGRIANTAGDSVLAEFPSAVDAIQCAIAIQEALTQTTQEMPVEKRLQFRIGVHVGDVLVHGSDLLGDGVNIAARLESLADPGGICISEATFSYVRKAVPVGFTDLGPQTVKNIEEPIRAYALKVISPVPAGIAQTKPLSLPDKPSIAVLPFTNMSGNPEHEYFADGMTEDIITGLSHLKWLFVIARNSTFAYKGRAADVRQISQDLGVRYVFEGGVRVSGARIRITGQLIEAASGRHIWAERYDRQLDDVFAVQDEITASVVAAIEPHLYAEEGARIASQSPENISTWGLVVRSIGLISKLGRQENEEARSLLERAITIEPTYAKAPQYYAGLCGGQATTTGFLIGIKVLPRRKDMRNRRWLLTPANRGLAWSWACVSARMVSTNALCRNLKLPCGSTRVLRWPTRSTAGHWLGLEGSMMP
jgi:adenylate cyclase